MKHLSYNPFMHILEGSKLPKSSLREYLGILQTHLKRLIMLHGPLNNYNK